MKKDIELRLIRFSVTAYQMNGKLQKTEFSSNLYGQLIRSATSSALNYGEAQGAETTRDFIHKIGLVLKELRESRVNLRIILKSSICDDFLHLDTMLREVDELIAIFYATLKTARAKMSG